MGNYFASLLILVSVSNSSQKRSEFRLLKKYCLNYRMAPTAKFAKVNAIVPGNDIVLTSASGVISSIDEFYAITGRHSRITVAGIDIRYEESLTEARKDLSTTLFIGARIMAANRLATSSRSWAKLMKRDPYGAKQWLLVDRKVLQSYNALMVKENEDENELEPEERLHSPADNMVGLLWVVDNVPNRLHGEDVTQQIVDGHKQLHLFGVPYFAETLAESGISMPSETEFEGLRLKETESKHSLRFYALATDQSEYMEGLTVMHSNDVGSQGAAESIPSGEAGEGEGEKGPSLSMAGFSSKWTWA